LDEAIFDALRGERVGSSGWLLLACLKPLLLAWLLVAAVAIE
jgi:hypothetical protein